MGSQPERLGSVEKPGCAGLRASWRRFFRGSLRRAPQADRAPAGAGARANGKPEDYRELIETSIRLGRYCYVLSLEVAEQIREADARRAWQALRNQMALVPAESAPFLGPGGEAEHAAGEAFYLDRTAVTNEQFQQFVAAGAYELLELWPRAVWPALMKFVDRSGRPGPRYWNRGRYGPGRDRHPVVGICWYEAVAYAQMMGKRLPTAWEWRRACGWPAQLAGEVAHRYPWGDVFDPARANLWSSGRGGTVPVEDFAAGDTANGIRQMAGNVWHWLSDPLLEVECWPGQRLEPWKPMRRIVGGAFNTYLPNEAACEFVTGQGELDRRDNVGFRCAVSLGRLRVRCAETGV